MDIYPCPICKSEFTVFCNLKRHVKTFHPDKLSEIVRPPSLPIYLCHKCDKKFKQLKNLEHHVKHHDDYKKATQLQRCAICSYSAEKECILQHYTDVHELDLKEESAKYDSYEEFESWKDQFEKDTNSKFIKNYLKRRKDLVYIGFVCHRSGFYVPEGKGIRNLNRETNKINGLCPARINVKRNPNGKCEVRVLVKHVGHKNDIKHLRLTPTERETIASKIAAKVPFNQILKEIRNSVEGNDIKRLHLLTKKDLYNIQSSVNVSQKFAEMAIEASILGLQDKGDVLFYKPIDSTSEEWPTLKRDDFMLVILSDAQHEKLRIFSRECVCVDKINSEDLQLLTLAVLDNASQGFPCAFCISNRSDKEILKIFFYYVRLRTGHKIFTNVFMSDVAEEFFEAWTEVMSSPKLRLYSTWDVENVWRQKLSEITTEERQMEIYNKLHAILEETNYTAFENAMTQFFKETESGTDFQTFAQYLKETFMDCTPLWASCYRLNDVVDVSGPLQGLHMTLEHAYLAGKNAKRLDRALASLIRLVKILSVEPSEKAIKGKPPDKVKMTKSRHLHSNELDLNCMVTGVNGWIFRSDDKTETYFIQEMTRECECTYRCEECKICYHMFKCSCQDYAEKYNICKHVHLLCRFRKENGDAIMVEDDSAENSMEIICEDSSSDSEVYGLIPKEDPSPPSPEETFEDKKERIKQKLLTVLETIQTREGLETFESLIEAAEETITDIKQSSSSVVQKTEDSSNIKTLIPQMYIKEEGLLEWTAFTSSTNRMDKILYINLSTCKRQNTTEAHKKYIKVTHDDRTYKCANCSYQTYIRCNWHKHMLTHAESDTVPVYRCAQCSFETKTKPLLASHLLIHAAPGRVKMYRCLDCPYETKQFSNLRQHKLVHSDSTEMFKCAHCSFETNRKGNLKDHVLRHEQFRSIDKDKELIKCDKCPFTTTIKYYMARHVKKHFVSNKVKNYPCSECSHISQSRYEYYTHKAIHRSMFKCAECLYESKRKCSLIKHVAKHRELSTVPIYRCTECAYETKTQSNLHIHQLEHKQVSIFYCSECIYQTDKKINLWKHMRGNHEDLPLLQCFRCSYQTTSKHNLRNHVKTHGSHTYHCQECSYKCKKKGYLRDHIRRNHPKEYTKPPKELPLLECAECTYKTARKGNLIGHIIRMHATHKEGYALYKCAQCSYETSTKNYLTRHNLMHHTDNLPLLKCNDCTYTTTLKKYLDRHKKVHADPDSLKMYSCDYCSHKAKRPEHLRRHIQRIHSAENKNFKNKCHLCSYRSKLKTHLTGHLKGVHGISNHQDSD